MPGREQSLAAEQEAAIAVGHGQGMAVEPVTGTEVALEVRRPDLVGSPHEGVGSAGVAQAGSSARLWDQTVAFENVASGAAGRPFPMGVASGDNLQQLLGSPAGMPPASLEQSLGDLGRSLMRTGVGAPGQVRQASGSFGLVPIDPLVPGLAADPVPVTELRDTQQLTLVIADKPHLLIHG